MNFYIAIVAIALLVGATPSASAFGIQMTQCEYWRLYTVYRSLQGQIKRQDHGILPPPTAPGYHWMCQPILIGEEATEVPNDVQRPDANNQGSGVAIGLNFSYGYYAPPVYYRGWRSGGYVVRQRVWVPPRPMWNGNSRWHH